MEFEPEIIPVRNIDRALSLPIACQSCKSFTYIGWETDELNIVFGMACQTQIGICELKNQKLFGTYVCDDFNGWHKSAKFEAVENREKPYDLC